MAVHTGHCLCGAVTFRADVPKAEADACHCSMCRRSAGGPVIAVIAQDATFSGDALRVYRSSEWGERLFCGTCGSNLAWRMHDGSFVSIPTGAFDPPIDVPLHMEIFVDDKPTGYAFAGERKRLTGDEVRALFEGGT